jgi:hypothetical protein
LTTMRSTFTAGQVLGRGLSRMGITVRTPNLGAPGPAWLW